MITINVQPGATISIGSTQPGPYDKNPLSDAYDALKTREAIMECRLRQTLGSKDFQRLQEETEDFTVHPIGWQLR